MNGTHTFATIELVTQPDASSAHSVDSASSATEADPRTGFEANLRFRAEKGESRTEADGLRTKNDQSRIEEDELRTWEGNP
jgi:hypothetical protein